MKIQTETVDYAPVIPSHPWATADRDVYTSGDLVPKGYERTFVDTGCVPVDDDGRLAGRGVHGRRPAGRRSRHPGESPAHGQTGPAHRHMAGTGRPPHRTRPTRPSGDGRRMKPVDCSNTSWQHANRPTVFSATPNSRPNGRSSGGAGTTAASATERQWTTTNNTNTKARNRDDR